MPLPRALGRFNVRVTNRILGPIVTRLPWFGWLEHVGRRSGRAYRTPITCAGSSGAPGRDGRRFWGAPEPSTRQRDRAIQGR